MVCENNYLQVCLDEVCVCADNVRLDVLAEETEKIYAVYEFNGMRMSIGVNAVGGEAIEIKNKFPLNYLVKMRLVKGNGSDYNNMIYIFNVVQCVTLYDEIIGDPNTSPQMLEYNNGDYNENEYL